VVRTLCPQKYWAYVTVDPSFLSQTESPTHGECVGDAVGDKGCSKNGHIGINCNECGCI